MSIQKKPPVPSLLVNTEPLIIVKNEPPEPEIVETGIDDILDSSDEEISTDIKDIDIVEHILCEDSIKTETVPTNLLESKYSKSVETQIIVKTENASFIKTENLTESENLNKTEDASNGNVNRGSGPGVVEVQGSNEDFNALENLETHEHVINFYDDLNDISIRSGKPECPKKTDFAKSSKTSETTSLKGDKEEIKVIKAPVVPVEPHEYTLSKDKYAFCNHCQFACDTLKYVKLHIQRKHRKIVTMYQCSNCPYQSKRRDYVRNHIILEHKDIKNKEWFKCHFCDKKFKLKYQLASHILIHQQSLRHHIKTYHYYHMKIENKYLLKTDQEKRYYGCEMCETYRRDILNDHKIIHLKPQDIQYFYCYHCSFQSRFKGSLRTHIVSHFKKEEIKFHCYICDFMTLKRDLITEHIKKHYKVQSSF